MSVIATVYIPEGIIMAADSRVTGETKYENGNVDRYTISDNGQKIFLLKNLQRPFLISIIQRSVWIPCLPMRKKIPADVRRRFRKNWIISVL